MDTNLDNENFEENAEIFDYKRFISRLKRLWWVFLLSLMGAGVLAVIFIVFVPPMYAVNASILV